MVKLPPQNAAVGPCGASLGVDTDPLHRRQVNDQAAIIGSVTGGAMTPAAHRHQQGLLAREADRVPYIRGSPAARHQRGAPVDVAVPDPPGVLVAGIAGADQVTPEHFAQGGHRLRAQLPGWISLRYAARRHVPLLRLTCSSRGLAAKVVPSVAKFGQSYPGASQAGRMKRWTLADADLHSPHPPMS